MFKKIRDIQSQIAWVYDPTSYISHDSLVQLVILQGRNILPAIVAFQKYCKRFLGMKKFVKEFCHLLPSNINYVEFTRTENGVVKTGMRLENESENSYVKTNDARTLIIDALRKARDDLQKKRDECKEWIATRNRWLSYTQFTICLFVSVMVLAYVSPYYARNKIGRV